MSSASSSGAKGEEIETSEMGVGEQSVPSTESPKCFLPLDAVFSDAHAVQADLISDRESVETGALKGAYGRACTRR